MSGAAVDRARVHPPGSGTLPRYSFVHIMRDTRNFCVPYHPLCAHLAVVQKELSPCAIFLPQTPAAHSPTLSSSTSGRRQPSSARRSPIIRTSSLAFWMACPNERGRVPQRRFLRPLRVKGRAGRRDCADILEVDGCPYALRC